MEHNLHDISHHISRIIYHAEKLNKKLTSDTDIKALLGIFSDAQELRRNEEARQIKQIRRLSDLIRTQDVLRGAAYDNIDAVKEVIPVGYKYHETIKQITTTQLKMEQANDKK